MTGSHAIGFLVVALSLASCAFPPPPAPAKPAVPPTQQPAAAPAQAAGNAPTPSAPFNETALNDLLKKWTVPNNDVCDAPGAVLLVDTPSGRFLKAAGVASLATQRPMQTNDRLEIGSNTKAFTAILALQLQEAGVWSMDDPLAKWLPALAARIPNGEHVTLRQLAGNTAGIADYADPLMQPAVDNNDQAALAKAYAPDELIKFVLSNGRPAFAPGEGWQYSSTNFILLGMAIEAATKKPLAELYRERIFDPLGMTDSSYLTGVPDPGSIVDGYYKVPDGDLVNMTGWNATQGGAAGGIVSTAEDMSRFIAGLFEGKLFQNSQTLDEMLDTRQLTMEQGGGVFAGYGLGLAEFGAPGYQAFGHGGQTPGFQSLWLYVPAARASLVFLTNSGTCRVMFMPVTLGPELFGLKTEGDPQTSMESSATSSKSNDLETLKKAYGAPSQVGFGSAVFSEPLTTGDSLEKLALARYKYFTGDLWNRYGEAAWMGPWKEVYARKAGAKADIVAELRSITDADAALSVPMILDNIENAESARAALSAVFDDPLITEFRVYNLGDGGAMSGILIAGRRDANHDATLLIFLLD